MAVMQIAVTMIWINIPAICLSPGGERLFDECNNSFEVLFMPFRCHVRRKNSVAELVVGVPRLTPPLAITSGGMMNWLCEIAGRSQLAIMWLATVAIGAVIYFFPIAQLLESLAE
jgi:hypothetical protein